MMFKYVQATTQMAQHHMRSFDHVSLEADAFEDNIVVANGHKIIQNPGIPWYTHCLTSCDPHIGFISPSQSSQVGLPKQSPGSAAWLQPCPPPLQRALRLQRSPRPVGLSPRSRWILQSQDETWWESPETREGLMSNFLPQSSKE